MNSSLKGIVTKTKQSMVVEQIKPFLDTAEAEGITVNRKSSIEGWINDCSDELMKLQPLLQEDLASNPAVIGDWVNRAAEVREDLKLAKRKKKTWDDYGWAVYMLTESTKLFRLRIFDCLLNEAGQIVDQALGAKRKVIKAEEESGKFRDLAQKNYEASKQSLEATRETLGKVKGTSLWAEKRKAQLEQNGTRIDSILRKASQSHQTIADSENEVVQIKSASDALRVKILDDQVKFRELVIQSQSSVEDGEVKLSELIDKLTETESKADEILFKATSAKFVETWELRREALADRLSLKQNLVYGTAILATVLAGFAIFLLFWLKLSWIQFLLAKLIIAPPLVFLIWFTSKQYSRERAMEADYALKVNIGVSLEGYKIFLDGMAHDEPTKAKVAEFYIETIGRLYGAPDSLSRDKGTIETQVMAKEVASKGIDLKEVTDLIKAVGTLKP